MKRCFRMLVASLFVSASWVSVHAQSGPGCDSGIVRYSNGVNGSLTVCPAIAAQMPALAKQLADIGKTITEQNKQIADLQRLVKSVNNVSRSLGAVRQTQLLENILARLGAARDAGDTHLSGRVTSLADDLEATQDQMMTALSDPVTAASATTALQGKVGDAIVRLDFTTVHAQLADLVAQLRAVGAKIDAVQETTTNIEGMVAANRISAANVQAALVSADINVLRLLPASLQSANLVASALRQKTTNGAVANDFFTASMHSPEPIEWLGDLLKAGLDPNMRVPGQTFSEEALIIAAMRSSNVAAMKVLLEHGASPHGFQDLASVSVTMPRLLLPLSYIAEDARISRSEKQDLVGTFLKAGLVVPAALPMSTFSDDFDYELGKMREQISRELDKSLPLTATLCEQPVTPICSAASSHDKKDWCSIVDKMPHRLVDVERSGSSPIGILELQYLLAIEDGKVYYLAQNWGGYGDNALVETSEDGSSWEVLRYARAPGSGSCKSGAPYCWQGFSVNRTGTNQMESRTLGEFRLENASCQVNRPSKGLLTTKETSLSGVQIPLSAVTLTDQTVSCLVYVTTPSGAPATGLQVTDFTVDNDNKLKPIRSFRPLSVLRDQAAYEVTFDRATSSGGLHSEVSIKLNKQNYRVQACQDYQARAVSSSGSRQ